MEVKQRRLENALVDSWELFLIKESHVYLRLRRRPDGFHRRWWDQRWWIGCCVAHSWLARFLWGRRGSHSAWRPWSGPDGTAAVRSRLQSQHAVVWSDRMKRWGKCLTPATTPISQLVSHFRQRSDKEHLLKKGFILAVTEEIFASYKKWFILMLWLTAALPFFLILQFGIVTWNVILLTKTM